MVRTGIASLATMRCIHLVIVMMCCLHRRGKDHMYLGGLWCSTKNPPTFTFLEPSFRQFKELEDR